MDLLLFLIILCASQSIFLLQVYSMSVSSIQSQLNLVRSFVPRSFAPPLLQSNAHYQTIIGSEALRVKYFGSYPRNFHTVRERFLTPDQDFFDVDFTLPLEDMERGEGIVVLVHGLESNAQGPLMTKMAAAFLAQGFACALVSFRGCSGEPNLTPGAYHLGFTTDLHQLLNTLHQRYPHQKIYFSGFSLGGNVVLKLLGELGDQASAYGVGGGVATCVPFDPIMSQGKIDKGFNRAVYSENFLSTLKAKAEIEYLQFPSAFDINRIRRCKTIGEFDDAYIAPIYNFTDKLDYYRKTGSKWYLSKIRVPAIAINARDDPLIEEVSLPTEEDVGDIAPVRLIYHDSGGHCGFLADRESYRLPNADNADEIHVPSHGWLADELARAIWHIHTGGDPRRPYTHQRDLKIVKEEAKGLNKAQALSALNLLPILLCFWSSSTAFA